MLAIELPNSNDNAGHDDDSDDADDTDGAGDNSDDNSDAGGEFTIIGSYIAIMIYLIFRTRENSSF